MSTFSHDARERWSDLDAQGHVNNAIYLDYLQEARVAFFGASGGTLLADGIVVVSHSLEYLLPISYDGNPVTVELCVASVGGAKFELAYELVHDAQVRARARTVLCPYDFASGAPLRLPDAERDHLMAHHRDVEPLREVPIVALGERGFASPIATRWSDLDSYAHVNNVKFFDFVQQARIEMTTAADPSMARMGAGSGSEHAWLVARQDLAFVNQMPYSADPYEARTAVLRFGTTSLTLGCELLNPRDETVFSRSTTVLVCADETGRARPLPESTRARLEQYLVD